MTSDRPFTLRELAGVSATPPQLARSALIVIDAQLEYVDGKLPLTGVGAALDRIAGLLAAARRAGAPVIHVQHRGRAGGAFDPETLWFDIAPQAAPRAGEPVIEKTLPNAFAGTILAEVIDATGVKQLVLAGFMTHMCVSTTARAAIDRGYVPTVLSDATATRDLPDPTGGPPIRADVVHRVALAELADRFAVVCTCAGLR